MKIFNYQISEHKDEIITSIVKNLVWLPIAATIPLIWKLIQLLFKNTSLNNIFTFSNILAVVAIAISIATVVIVIKLKKGKPETPKKEDLDPLKPITDLRINKLEAEFHIKSSDKIISTLDYNITANIDGLQHFIKPILWTGDKYNGTKLIEKDSPCYTLHDKGVNDGYHICEVNFNKEIKCQDKIRFKLQTEVSDTNCKMQPFYGYTVKHQIDKLILRVVIEPNKIHNVRKSICWDWERQMAVETPKLLSKKIIGDNEVYEVEIPNPTLLYKYFIEWEFTN